MSSNLTCASACACVARALSDKRIQAPSRCRRRFFFFFFSRWITGRPADNTYRALINSGPNSSFGFRTALNFAELAGTLSHSSCSSSIRWIVLFFTASLSVFNFFFQLPEFLSVAITTARAVNIPWLRRLLDNRLGFVVCVIKTARELRAT